MSPRVRRVAIAVAAWALCGVDIARAATSARARAPSSRPREPDGDRADVDREVVQDFLTTARDEFLADYAVRGANGVEVDWIASFFLDGGRSSASRTARSRGSGRDAQSRRDGPRVEVDETGIEFFLAARAYAAEHAVSDPRSGRATIMRSEEASDLQWWYDFIFATQRRWIDCTSNADCESIFHRGDGTFCCDAGADFWGHTHNSCVESEDECVKICERDPNPFRSGNSESCKNGQFCCKRRNRASHDWNVCVDHFQDCADFCEYGVGNHQCKSGEQCCFVDILGYTVCVDENLNCPPPPPECPPGDEGNNRDVRSNDGRFCCGGNPCPESTESEPWQCCQVCEQFVCIPGTTCPPQFCDPPPICQHAGTAFHRCPLNPSISPVEDGECCGGSCCDTTTSSCCLNTITAGLECVIGECPGPPVESCANRPNLEPCGSNRFCCSGSCCDETSFCCPVIDRATGAITGYTCASDCEQPLCRFERQCENGQQYGVCGSCGNGNGDCGLACQACVGVPPNELSANCVYTMDNPLPPYNDRLCDGAADFLTAISSGPNTWTCNCNNGQCGGHVGCKGQRGNCCACQSNNARGGCQCSPAA